MNQKETKEADIGITAKKKENFSEWYTQVIQKAELADYTDVSGCIVFRPRSYAIWEKVQKWFDKEIKKLGVKNAYFPLFIPKRLLEKETEHVEGFTPEVAWVTQAGESKLNEWLAVRPTSETIMYNSYKKWIRSHRDLPLRLNQWCNVVRWEFKNPVPFIRTREFLWQEGHTAFATKKEAEKEVKEILNLYKQVYEELYAVPAIIGRKSEKEKFAGAEYTTSVETFVPSGKAVQAATSHFLGQNFSKAFDISFLDKEGQKRFVYQNSWGMSTRTIGVMIMMHGDDKGLIIPPRVAPLHVMIVPILFEKTKDKVITAAKKLYKDLQGDEFTVEIDLREGYTSGWKFNEWELKGVPIRIEIGPKDIEKKQAVLVRRDTGEKEVVKINKVRKRIPKLLEEIQENLFNQAKKFLKNNTKKADNWLDFEKAVKEKKLVYAPWCNATKCEEKIKEKTGAKVLNIPFKHVRPKGKCIFCNNPAKVMAYFAKSY
ncbi:proline--tRNA ligase [Candidatus Woesearchaeota archaeon ex4484_78]|nr:MAG: proline--tRNA ligase [Candidatus Woesearchaeota archaeon ex4484_78]